MLYKTSLLQGQQPLEQTALTEWRLPGGASSKLVVFLHTGAEVKGAHLCIESRGCGVWGFAASGFRPFRLCDPVFEVGKSWFEVPGLRFVACCLSLQRGAPQENPPLTLQSLRMLNSETHTPKP